MSLGKPTCDTFKASSTSRTFNVVPLDHKSPSHVPMWDEVSRDSPFGKPTCDTFKASRTSRTFNVFPLDHKSPSPVPMWDEVSRDSPFGKPTVTRREVITPTGRSRTRHSKTQMPNVMDVHTPICPCTNVVKSTVTTTELSPIRGIILAIRGKMIVRMRLLCRLWVLATMSSLHVRY